MQYCSTTHLRSNQGDNGSSAKKTKTSDTTRFEQQSDMVWTKRDETKALSWDELMSLKEGVRVVYYSVSANAKYHGQMGAIRPYGFGNEEIRYIDGINEHGALNGQADMISKANIIYGSASGGFIRVKKDPKMYDRYTP